ncbi:MAG: hypothetical protein ICV77_09760 [Cyanobacteria bacterium Co-bin8]|nr:hypothetical protein [Cyanobacteria bacterium Co-bin8]
MDALFRTPAIYSPDMSQADWEGELNNMLIRAQATGDFLAGRISPADFEDILSSAGISDPFELAARWEEGKSWDGPI